jgi:uncharacterized protein with HEPN domain
MLLDDQIRLRHMMDAAQQVTAFVQNRIRADLEQDRMLVLALTKGIEIVGEAASRLTDATRNNHPEIPWAGIIGMRNRLIHAYFDINLDILWQTIEEDIPALIGKLKSIGIPTD